MLNVTQGYMCHSQSLNNTVYCQVSMLKFTKFVLNAHKSMCLYSLFNILGCEWFVFKQSHVDITFIVGMAWSAKSPNIYHHYTLHILINTFISFISVSFCSNNTSFSLIRLAYLLSPSSSGSLPLSGTESESIELSCFISIKYRNRNT